MRTYRLTRSWADPRMQHLAEWCAQMMSAAEATAANIGCSPEAVVAQAALETGWGAAAIGHNLFGVKAGAAWKGNKQLVWTREVLNGQSVMLQDWFRDYDSYADSFADHFDFLSGNSRYAAVFDPNDTKSDAEYFVALQRAGYATDPHYAESLTAMLKSVHLFTAAMTIDNAPPAPPPARLLAFGSAGPDVMALQAKLNVDEEGFGPKTREAVAVFQLGRRRLDPKFDVDGIVGSQTRTALGL